MKLSEIVGCTAHLLGQNGVLELLEKGVTSDADAQKTLDFLVRCANIVIKEIASEYIPLKAVETVSVDGDGKVEYSQLTKRALAVVSVRDGRDEKIKFRAYPSFLSVPVSGEVTVEYTYVPSDAALTDDTEYSAQISPHTVAYGTAAEYCIISGLFDEAGVWDARFRAGITTASGKRCELRLPQRSWI